MLNTIFYLRYTPSQQGVAYNSGAKQRIIRMVEAQKDPMEPPKFKYALYICGRILTPVLDNLTNMKVHNKCIAEIKKGKKKPDSNNCGRALY